MIWGGGGYGYDITTGFKDHEKAAAQKLTATAHRAILRIDSALHRGDPATAKTMLEMSLQQAILPPETVGSLQTRIAAGYFYKGDQEEARHLTDVSYLQDNPRACGSTASAPFKTDNMSGAAASFVALANRNDLTDGDHAAAAFWAYRSLKAAGDHADAESWLHEAAKQPHSFYGLLASNLSGQSVETAWSWHVPVFDRHAADQLIAMPAAPGLWLGRRSTRWMPPKPNCAA